MVTVVEHSIGSRGGPASRGLRVVAQVCPQEDAVVDYELDREGFQGMLQVIDNTVLDLPQVVMDALTAGEELASALEHSTCGRDVSRVVDTVLRTDLTHLTLGCENVAGAGHEVLTALGRGDEEMAEDAIQQGVR